MTIEGMIWRLQTYLQHGGNPKAKMRAFDADTGRMQEVSGLLHDGDGKYVEICTDEN